MTLSWTMTIDVGAVTALLRIVGSQPQIKMTYPRASQHDGGEEEFEPVVLAIQARSLGETSPGSSRRCVEGAFNQVRKRLNFAVGQVPGPSGNRKTGGESSNEDAPVADRWAHVFAKGSEFVDQLLALKRSAVDPVGDEDQPGNAMQKAPSRVDNFKRACSCFEVQARRRTGDHDQIGYRACGAKRTIVGCGIQDDIIGVDPLHRLRPSHDRLFAQYQLGNWKIEISRVGPAAGGTLGIGVDQNHAVSACLEFSGQTNRHSGLANAAFALGDGDDPSHLWLMPDACHGALVVNTRGLLFDSKT